MGKQLIIKNADFSSVAISEENLDTTAYENFTFRTLFETNNLLGISAGFESGSFSPLRATVGTAVITDEISDSGTYSLKAFGNASCYVQNSTVLSETLLLACRVRCDRYISGISGVIFKDDGAITTETTGGEFVTKTALITKTAGNLFVGNAVRANADTYIDTPVVVNINIFGSVPSLELFTNLYDRYVNIKKKSQN